MTRVSQPLDRIEVIFDDDEPGRQRRAVAGRRHLSIALGLEPLIDDTVRLVGRVGGARPGRKVLTLVHSMLAGGSHIDHADVLRAGGRHGGAGPSGDGTLDVGDVPAGLHVRACPSARSGERPRTEASLGDSVWHPTTTSTIDIDSTICEVAGKRRQGAAFGYTRVLGYHPILATRADTGEIAACPDAQRLGEHPTRGASVHRRTRRPRSDALGATGAARRCAMDSGFWSKDTIAALGRLDVRFTMAIRTRVPDRRGGDRTASTRPLGSTSTTPTAARPRSPRRPTRPASSPAAWSCAAPG